MMKKCLTLILMSVSISLSAQDNSLKQLGTVMDLTGVKKMNTDILTLTDVDLRVVNSLPTLSDYLNLAVKLKKLPKEYLRCIDSIDYQMTAKDTLLVRIYSQDYAYQSRNGYKIGLNIKDQKATLKLYNIYYDMKMKSDIADYELFMRRQFKYSVITKAIEGKEKIKRTIIAKKYNYDGRLTHTKQ